MQVKNLEPLVGKPENNHLADYLVDFSPLNNNKIPQKGFIYCTLKKGIIIAEKRKKEILEGEFTYIIKLKDAEKVLNLNVIMS